MCSTKCESARVEGPPTGLNAVSGDLGDFKEEDVFYVVVSRLIRWILLLGGLVFLGSVFRAYETGWQPLFTIDVAVMSVLISVFVFRRRMPARAIAASVIVVLYLLCVLNLISFGLLAVGGMVGLAGVCVLAGTVYGLRTGIMTALSTGVVFAAIMFAVRAGHLPLYDGSADVYLVSLPAWINAGIDMVVVAVVLILCIGTIQERLAAVSRLNRAELAFTDMALNAQQDLFFVFDLETGKVIRWNRALKEVTGLRDEQIGALTLPDDLEGIIDLQQMRDAMRRLEHGRTNHFETDVITDSGERIPIEFRSVVVDDPIQNRTLVISVGRDLTGRRASEQALHAIEQRFRIVLENVPTVVWTADLQGNATYISPNVEQVCGYSGDEIMTGGRAFWESHILEEDKPAALEAINGLRRPDRSPAAGPLDFRYRLRKPDGRYAWIHHQAAVVTGNDGESILCGVFSDITEQVETIQRLQQAEKLQALGELTGGLAHDFNNQMSAILGCVDLLSGQGAAKPKEETFIRHIRSSASHASDLVRRLLALSRQRPPLKTAADAHQTIADVAALMHGTLSAETELVMRLDAEAPIIMCDLTELQSALLNLLINARDAMPGGGRLTIATHRTLLSEDTDSLSPAPFLSIAISDTGIGMDEATQQHIFEPFFTTKPEGKGTGLGLSKVSGFATAHGGKVQVSSEPGRGTTITLFLPLSNRIESDAPVHTVPATMKSILLVDDEADVLQSLAEMLQDCGFDVHCFEKGRDAVEDFRRHNTRYDLVILDMVMPDWDGKQTLEALKAVDRKTKVLFISAHSVLPDLQPLIDERAIGFMSKPFGPDELKHTVTQMLD